MSNGQRDAKLHVTPQSGEGKRFYGKYRGKVIETVDPLRRGRLKAKVPAVPQSTNFATPCVPYAGPQVGLFAMPPIGANVWIEFEGGDPTYPIWSGCFWDEGELPVEATDPMVKLFKTEATTLMLNDTPDLGGIVLACTPPAVESLLAIRLDADGIQLAALPAAITLTPEEGITIDGRAVAINADGTEITSLELMVNGELEVNGDETIDGQQVVAA